MSAKKTGKVALITGITGQDGSYLCELLLSKGDEYSMVHGIMRRGSLPTTARIDHIWDDPKMKTHYGDMTDAACLTKLVAQLLPDEIYNLAAQSHVAVSFACPQYTNNCDAGGVLALLDAIQSAKIGDTCRLYQASTSELFGSTPPPQNERSPMVPQSPYAVAKLAGFHYIRLYREAYKMHASNGILFNHESERRGINFVTRKIARGAAAVKAGKSDCLRLGNLNAKRDWGHAKDYVRAMYLIVQHNEAGDYALGTDTQHTVRDFCDLCFGYLNMPLTWEGEGEAEVGKFDGKTVVAVDPQYFRPAEVESLMSDSKHAKEKLGWQPEISFQELVSEMMDNAIAEYGTSKN